MIGIFGTALRHKIWFDLWGSKQRTLQAILTITVGAFAIGAIFGGWNGISHDAAANYLPTQPPSVNMIITPPADAVLLDTLRRDSRLSAVEGVMRASIKWRPNPATEWSSATLQAREDYTAQQLALLRLEAGAWPSGQQIAIQRGFRLGLGGQVELKIDERISQAPISGVLYDLSTPPASLGGNPTFYTSRAQFATLTGQDRFSQILATVPDYTRERSVTAAAAVQATLQDYGISAQPGGTSGTIVVNPLRAFFQDPVEGVGTVLQTIGVVAVGLSLLLVYNTVTAIVTQQTSQIGELKAIGATSRQILFVYFTIVFVYGLIALLIAVPLGLLAANGLRRNLILTFGMTPAEWVVMPNPILYQVGICMLAPLLVAVIPVMQGARVTVREAISSYGLSGGGWIDGVLARLSALPRVVSLALSNAFRNLGRVATTQLALAGAGITFMAVMSARTTMIYSLGTMLFDTYAYQVQLDLEQVASMARIEQVSQVPGVTAVEVWRQQSVTVRRADAPPQPTDPSPSVSGVPVPTSSYTPLLKAGRLLESGDTYAIVMQEVLARDAGVTVGDWVMVSIADPTNTQRWISEKPWQVVGVIIDPNFVSGALVPRETLFGEIGRREGNRVQIQSADSSAAGTLALATQARAFFDEREMPVRASTTDTVTQRSERQLGNLSAVIVLLLLGAVIVAVIGAISLNGTLAISVLERRREIGVLRAIGATPGTIRTQFLIEGMVMAVLSWLIALVFAYPAGLLTAQAVGASLRTSVIFHFDWLGVWLWLALACVIAVIASLSPAQQAIRASVQESLAYE